ncbi:MAG TPA: 30S ribosomal protein S6 [bacterium]|jgi:small subunit ribosomal protein S6
MKTYELTLILDAQLPPEKQEELVTKYLDLLKSKNVEILTVEKWGKKKMAYVIEDRQYGYYLMTQFRAPAELVPEIEHFLKVTPGIFRHLILLRDPRTLKLMQNEGERLAREVSRLAEQERLALLERDVEAIPPGIEDEVIDIPGEEKQAGSSGKE